MQNLSKLEEAIILATNFHAGQVDKADQPYILHPLRVMQAVTSEKERIVAVIHDIVEDTEVDLSYIQLNFGMEVAVALDHLTRREGESYSNFINRCKENDLARVVKKADIMDNMNLGRLKTITDEDVKRNMKYSKALGILMKKE